MVAQTFLHGTLILGATPQEDNFSTPLSGGPDMEKPESVLVDVEDAQAEAMKIMTDAKKLLEQTGLEVSLITRCPDGARWPVLMLEVGQNCADIEAVRSGKR